MKRQEIVLALTRPGPTTRPTTIPPRTAPYGSPPPLLAQFESTKPPPAYAEPRGAKRASGTKALTQKSDAAVASACSFASGGASSIGGGHARSGGGAGGGSAAMDHGHWMRSSMDNDDQYATC